MKSTPSPGGTGERITRKSGSNLALSFICLPREQRQAMSTFYAFCRTVDDIVDETSANGKPGYSFGGTISKPFTVELPPNHWPKNWPE